MKETEWREIVKGSKPNFIRIVQTLNRYYSQVDQGSLEDKGFQFRKALTELPEDAFSIFLKRFGKYEYLVHAKLSPKRIKKQDNPLQMKEDTWIHIDGIQEERDYFKKKGIEDHPVFLIEAMTDIFESGSVASKRKDLPK